MTFTQWLIIACVAGATIIASTGNDGWGWLLFFAFFFGVDWS